MDVRAYPRNEVLRLLAQRGNVDADLQGGHGPRALKILLPPAGQAAKPAALPRDGLAKAERLLRRFRSLRAFEGLTPKMIRPSNDLIAQAMQLYLDSELQ